MEFKVRELINQEHKDNHIEGVISYKNKISDEILDVEDAKIKGYYKYDEYREMFTFHLHIQTVVTAPCVITLEPTKVSIDFDTDLFYTFKVVDDDSFEITGSSINLDEEVWGEIFMQMPIRVISEGAEFVQEDFYTVEKENPFSSLNEDIEEE